MLQGGSADAAKRVAGASNRSRRVAGEGPRRTFSAHAVKDVLEDDAATRCPRAFIFAFLPVSCGVRGR